MSPLEAALYVFVLGGGAEVVACTRRTESDISCSNGITVHESDDRTLTLSTGPRIRKTADGGLAFSTGLTVYQTGAGWMHFSNGLQVRRAGGNLYRFSNGFTCLGVSPHEARCLK